MSILLQNQYQTFSTDGANILDISPSAKVNVGEKVSLQCTAEGNPVPEVRWTFQNQNRTTGRQHTPLIIDKAKSADAGQYTCIATNELGTDTKTVSLTVQGKTDLKIKSYHM